MNFVLNKYNMQTGVTTLSYNGKSFSGKDKKELERLMHEWRHETDPEYKNWYDEEFAKELKIETVTTDQYSVGMVSLVGVGSDYPLGHGNYFSMNLEGFKDLSDIGIINIWYENLMEAIRRFDVDELTFEIFNDGEGMIVTSPKIPEEWYIKDLFMEYNCNLSSIQADKIRKLKGIK